MGAILFVVLTTVYQAPAIKAEFDEAESQRISKLNEDIPGTAEHFLRCEPPATCPEEPRARPWNAIAETTAIGLGGPIVVLCFGLLVGWVVAGFRTTRAN
jgi:hypothetical protein